MHKIGPTEEVEMGTVVASLTGEVERRRICMIRPYTKQLTKSVARRRDTDFLFCH